MYEYEAEVLRVIDGDTVELRIDLGLNIHVVEIVRLFGINAPELRAPRNAGLDAKKFLEDMIAKAGNHCIIETIKMPRTGREKKGKFGRWLGIIFIERDSGLANANELMLLSGNAVEYR